MSLKADIRRYISINRDAAETNRGVARVWLKLPGTEEVMRRVDLALDELVAEGTLEGHELPGGSRIYRRARSEEEREDERR
jgi:hypothetical protein